MPLPNRPRLADFAWARQHVVDGRRLVLIHDQRTGEALEFQPRQFKLLAAADGSRDMDGILLAASRCGALRRSSELYALLGQLHERALLADGIGPSEAAGPPSSKPVRYLDGYRFTCDGHGCCCRTYGSVRFSAREAECARVLVPNTLTGLVGPDELFLPLQGSVHDEYAGTMVDGACAYLDDDGRCRIHQHGGSGAKPLGCRSFPTTFVDEGLCIVVSTAVECPCVLASLGNDVGSGVSSDVGEGSKVTQVRTEAEIEPGVQIIRLPDRVQVSADREASLTQLRAWTGAVLDAATRPTGAQPDVVAACWSLAEALRTTGLDPMAARAALHAPPQPTPAAVAPWLRALRVVAEDRHRDSGRWRSVRDRTRLLYAGIARATGELAAPDKLAACLHAAHPYSQHESFYFRATLFGRHLAAYEASLEPALRDRALRLLVARQWGQSSDPAWRSDPAADYPLTAVEALMRGHGLWSYVNEVA